jgi:hypothetical protein
VASDTTIEITPTNALRMTLAAESAIARRTISGRRVVAT